MSLMERVFSINQMLRRRRLPTKADLLRRLSVSPATLKRDLDFMRDRLGAPIVWDRARRGYRYEESTEGQTDFQIPGLWFSPEEIRALMLMRGLLSQLQPGYLAEQLEPLGRRLHHLAEASGVSSERFVFRPVPRRPVNPQCFERVAGATIDRRRLSITYFGRNRNQESTRIISPQRLVSYRGAWYVDAWCH